MGNPRLGLKLIRKRRLKAKGIAPLPQSKAEQRAIAAALATQPATAIPEGKRALPKPYRFGVIDHS